MKYSNESLQAHAYGRTRNALSVEKREQALIELEWREDAEADKGSTACKYYIGAKSAEGLIRDLLNIRGVGLVIRDEGGHKYVDLAARPNRNNRGECRIHGGKGEVKTGGTLAYGVNSEDWSEEDLMPGKRWIAFCLLEEASDPELNPDPIDGICDWTALIPRAEFMRMLERASRKGIRGTLHLNPRGDVSFQPTPLKKLRAMIHEGIVKGELETLEGYLLDRA